jgi:transposase-like protein
MQRYGAHYPSAVQCYQDDLAACLNHLHCPAMISPPEAADVRFADEINRKRIRTTNLLERAFLEVRRRTQTTPHLFNE